MFRKIPSLKKPIELTIDLKETSKCKHKLVKASGFDLHNNKLEIKYCKKCFDFYSETYI